jgi:hypothetical protein
MLFPQTTLLTPLEHDKVKGQSLQIAIASIAVGIIGAVIISALIFASSPSCKLIPNIP